MKMPATSRRTVFYLLAVALAALNPSLSHAASGTWSTDSNGNWSDTTKWAGNIVGDGANNTADFSTVNVVSSEKAITLDSSRTIGYLRLGDSTSPYVAWNLNGTIQNPLTLSVSSGSPTITCLNVQQNVGVVLAGSQGLTKLGSAVLRLNGANTYAGDTTISAGTLKYGAVNCIPHGSGKGNVIVQVGATLDNNGFNPNNPSVINGLSGAGTVTDNSGAGITKTLTVGDNNQSSYFNGVIRNGASATLGLTKIGTGTLKLDGACTNTGVITVSAGALAIGAGGTSGTVISDIVNNSALFFNRSDNPPTYSGIISGTGTVTKQGGGILRINGVNTYAGDTTVAGGTLKYGAINCIPNGAGRGNVIVNSGATLDMNGGFVVGINGLSGGGTVNNTGSTGISTLTVGNNNATSTFSGSIINAPSGTTLQALTKAGSGTLTLSGNNSYSGATTVNAGKLTLIGALTGTSDVSINGGTLLLGANNRIPDAAEVTVAGGALDLGSFSETVGYVLLQGGAINGSGGTLSSAAAYFVDSGTVSANLSGTAYLVKDSAGTVTLNGVNTYTSVTAVEDGTLLVNGSLAAGSDVAVYLWWPTLGGSGTINGHVFLSSVATLSPGASTDAIGTLTLGVPPLLEGEVAMQVNKAGSLLASDKLVVSSGTLVYGGTLTVTATGDALTEGNPFDLFDAGSFSGSFGMLNLPTLVAGLQWNTSLLTVNGTISVERLQISITSPQNGASLNTTRVNVGGTFAATSIKRITVNGVPAFISGNNFEALNVALAEGANTITATAESLAGNTATASISITGSATPVDPVQLTASPVGGFAPLSVTFQAVNNAPGTFQQIQYDLTGDNTSFLTTDPSPYTYSTAGQYFPVVTIQTTAGRFSSLGGWNSFDANRLRINVQAPPVQLGSAINVTDPVDLKTTAAGNLYVLSRSTATITEYDASQTVVRSVSGIGTTPTGLDVDSAGNVYVTLSGDNQVAKYNPASGSFQLDATFGTAGIVGKGDKSSGTDNGEFNSPFDVTVTPDGSAIYVSDTSNHRIQKFAANGTFISAVGTQGSGFGQFNNPKGLSFGSDGMLLVVDSGNSRLAEFMGDEVYKVFGSSGTSPGQYQSPLNIASDSQKIYVADTGNNRIQKLDHDGNPVLQISSELGLSQAAGVSLAADSVEERIYIADTGNNRVVIGKLPPNDPPGGDPISIWNAAKQALINGNVETALASFSSGKADEYRALLTRMGSSRLNQSMTAIGSLTPISVDDDEARYYFSRTISGQQFMFVVTFEKENGQWRIRTF